MYYIIGLAACLFIIIIVATIVGDHRDFPEDD